MRLRGKAANVTGSGQDIGRACAMRLAAEGASVAINDYSSSDGAESAVSEIETNGGTAFSLQGDMTRESDAQALVAAAVERFGKVDIVVQVTGRP